MAEAQHWDLRVPDPSGVVVHHRVSSVPTSWTRTVTWTVDGDVAAEKKSSEDKLVLGAGTHGSVRILHSALGTPLRATWFRPDEELAAHTGIGGIDLDPEPGSKAAAREQRMRDQPRLYAARHVAAGVAKVVVPLAVVWLLSRFAFSLPFPHWDLPTLPRPDLPDLVPDISLPSLPDWHLPSWLRWILEKKNYVVPILIGVFLARAEVKRRRRQDELKKDLPTES